MMPPRSLNTISPGPNDSSRSNDSSHIVPTPAQPPVAHPPTVPPYAPLDYPNKVYHAAGHSPIAYHLSILSSPSPPPTPPPPPPKTGGPSPIPHHLNKQKNTAPLSTLPRNTCPHFPALPRLPSHPPNLGLVSYSVTTLRSY